MDRILLGLRRHTENLFLLQNAERKGTELLALLPEGVLRHRAQDRLRRAVEGFSVRALAEKKVVSRKRVVLPSGTPTADEVILQVEQ